MFLKSSCVAKTLGIPYHRLFSLLRAGKLSPPRKDGSGDYVWVEADIGRAREALTVDRRRRDGKKNE
jgi:hypothetical protein